MTSLKSLILKNRSYRRFDESHIVSREELLDMINAARLSASGRNAQTTTATTVSPRKASCSLPLKKASADASLLQ